MFKIFFYEKQFNKVNIYRDITDLKIFKYDILKFQKPKILNISLVNTCIKYVFIRWNVRVLPLNKTTP